VWTYLAAVNSSWLHRIEDYTFENFRNDLEFQAIIHREKEKKAVLRAQQEELEGQGEFDL